MSAAPEVLLPTMADALCAHLNCRNVAAWLLELAAALALPAVRLMPEPPVRSHRVLAEPLGLLLTLGHPHGGVVAVGDPDRWLITEVKFGPARQYGQAWQDALPFGLDAWDETPSSAAIRPGAVGETPGLFRRAVLQGDRRQTWFCDDALALEITWHASGRGIEHVWAVRLGGELLAPVPTWLRSSRPLPTPASADWAA